MRGVSLYNHPRQGRTAGVFSPTRVTPGPARRVGEKFKGRLCTRNFSLLPMATGSGIPFQGNAGNALSLPNPNSQDIKDLIFSAIETFIQGNYMTICKISPCRLVALFKLSLS